MFHLVPPAGMPISFREIIKIIHSRVYSDSCSKMFEEKIKGLTRVKYCYFLNSGRSSLLFILKALSEMADPAKVEVVIPAYTCFSVAASIAKSGLKIRLVDTDPLTMDYNYEKLSELDFSKVLAVIACNLFGILSNWKELRSIAQGKDVFLIDDAAQSLGSNLHNLSSGSLGDAGFFSLGRGKILTTYSGGILVTNNAKIAGHVEEQIKDLKKPSLGHDVKKMIEITLYSSFLRPKCYWLPEMIPFLGLGETVYDETFGFGHLTELQMCAGTILYSKLEMFNATRVQNAKKIAPRLLKSGKYIIPGYDEDICPAYLRLPVLAKDKMSRDQALSTLRRKGVVASIMYPSTIRRISGIEHRLASVEDDFPGAQKVVENLLTLPTHPYLSERDVHKIIPCLIEE